MKDCNECKHDFEAKGRVSAYNAGDVFSKKYEYMGVITNNPPIGSYWLGFTNSVYRAGGQCETVQNHDGGFRELLQPAGTHKDQVDTAACKKALKEKWYPLARGETPETDVCSLCEIYGGKNDTDGECGVCPLRAYRDKCADDCCDTYRAWEIDSTPENALPMVRLLEKVAHVDIKDSEISEKKKVVTNVTVWSDGQSDFLSSYDTQDICNLHSKGWIIETYHFHNTPDIPRVTAETFGVKPDGVFAVTIECSLPFTTEASFNAGPTTRLSLIKKELGIFGSETNNGKYVMWHGIYNAQVETAITAYLRNQIKVGDIVINVKGNGEPAIVTPEGTIDTKWVTFSDGITFPVVVEDLRKATSDEVDAYFTKEVNGRKFRATMTEYNGIELFVDGGHFTSLHDGMLVNIFVESNGIKVKPLNWKV